MRGKTAEDFRLLELLDPEARAVGYEIVRLRLMAGDKARRLQIMAERPDGTLPVEDCARLSRVLSDALDAADPISGGYLLEVSSPGVDRPLTRQADFRAYIGCEARIELDHPIDGRKRLRGELAGVAGDEVIVGAEGVDKPVRLPFGAIAEAKLVLNEALLQRGAQARAARLALDTPHQNDRTST